MATFTVNDRQALTGENSAADDYILIWDTSAGTHKKISRHELMEALGRSGFLSISGASGTERGVVFRTGGQDRFVFGINSTPESGADAGSKLYVNGFTDAGVYKFTAFEANRADSSFTIYLPTKFNGLGTTASAANVTLDGSNNLLKSTSSEEYKTAIEPLESWRADRVVDEAIPIWYRSLAPADDPDWSWYGLTAEQMAAIDPRLVQWSYRPSDYEETPVYQMIDGETRQVGVDRRLKEGAVMVPDGVAYERLTVMLLDVVRREKAKTVALEATLIDLVARVGALESA